MDTTRRRLLGSFVMGAAAVLVAACSQSTSTPAATTVPSASTSSSAPTTAPSAPTSSSAPTTAPSAPTSSSAPTTAPAATAAPVTGAVTIDIITWNSGTSAEAFKTAMSGINDKFKQKFSNVSVTFEMLGQGATWTNAQKTRIAAQKVDVTAMYGFAPADIINFQPDKQFIDLSDVPSIKNFDPSNVNRFMSWKGKVWQMTLAYVGHIVWTNEDILTKYNLQHPQTYADFQHVGDTLKSNNVVPILVGAKEQTSLNRFASMVEMTVQRPKHPQFWADLLTQGKADFTTPEWIETYKRAKDFSSKYFDPNFSGISYPTTAGLFASGKYAMMPDGSFAGGDIQAAKPTFQKLGAFTAAMADDPAANQVQPVYGDISWAGLNYSKSVDPIRNWLDFFGQKENYGTFMQVLQYYPTQSADLSGPVPQAESPLLKKTAVAMTRSALPGMVFDNAWTELLLSDKFTPETYAQYVQKNLDDSRPQWQKYIGMFDQDWAKLYFGQ
jgi:raffinose/stachyose/melibiose transport system substrate-binding protein